jgi:hypothetical protein
MSIDQPPRSGGFGKFGAAPKSLGSLAQSARTKQINQARILMYVIGILNLLGGAGLFFLANALANNPPNNAQQLGPEVATVARVAGAITIGIGVVFLILGALTKKYPVPTTVLGLIIYGTSFAINLANSGGQPQAFAGMIIPVIIIIALIRSVQAAIVYQREKNQAAVMADPLS